MLQDLPGNKSKKVGDEYNAAKVGGPAGASKLDFAAGITMGSGAPEADAP